MIVANELSFDGSAADLVQARERMRQFVDVLRTFRVWHPRTSIATVESFYMSPLADGYSLLDWLGDNGVDRDARGLVRSTITKTPFVPDLTVEYMFRDLSAVGLGYAADTGGIALSLSSDPVWGATVIPLLVRQIIDDNVVDGKADALNASEVEQIERHLLDRRFAALARVESGTQLVQQMSNFFPRVDFCDSALHQIRNLLKGDPALASIIGRLGALSQRTDEWMSGEFQIDGLPDTSNESQPTREKFGHLRRFKCPDGEERPFYLHMKIYAYNLRIHFLPMADSRRVLVGYVGKHLPTVQNP